MGGSAGGTCDITSDYGPCDSCFQAACNTECVALSNEPTYQDFWDCVYGCMNTACINQCFDDYPEAVAAQETFDACVQGQLCIRLQWVSQPTAVCLRELADALLGVLARWGRWHGFGVAHGQQRHHRSPLLNLQKPAGWGSNP